MPDRIAIVVLTEGGLLGAWIHGHAPRIPDAGIRFAEIGVAHIGRGAAVRHV